MWRHKGAFGWKFLSFFLSFPDTVGLALSKLLSFGHWFYSISIFPRRLKRLSKKLADGGRRESLTQPLVPPCLVIFLITRGLIGSPGWRVIGKSPMVMESYLRIAIKAVDKSKKLILMESGKVKDFFIELDKIFVSLILV